MSLESHKTLHLVKQYRLQWEEAQNAFVLLYPEGLIKLNDSAGEILKRIDSESSADHIVQSLEQAYPGMALRQDVMDFLEYAYENGWIRTD